MADRPILYSGPMVRALLAGRKTQTRRVLKPQPNTACASFQKIFVGPPFFESCDAAGKPIYAFHYPKRHEMSPYPPIRHAVGDRLWARETWAHYQTVNHVRRSHGGSFSEVSDGLAGYKADGHDTIEDFRDHIRLMSGCALEAVEINGDRWRPSIHMPRWASRLTLIVTDVRVQRLQEITRGDCMDEGCPFPNMADGPNPRDWFRDLWDSLNAKRGFGWDQNPWVVALTFDVIQANIDTLKEAANA